MIAAEPKHFFDKYQLQESLVLRFRYRPYKSSLDLVVDYAAEAVSQWFAHMAAGGTSTNYLFPPRHFLWMRFNGANTTSSEVPRISNDDIWRDYERRLTQSPVVVSGVELQMMTECFELRIAMQSFGWHFVQFQGMVFRERFGVAKEVGPNTWEYVDRDSHEPVAFDNPFPEIDADSVFPR